MLRSVERSCGPRSGPVCSNEREESRGAIRTRTTKDGSIVLEADEPFYARCLLCRVQFNGDEGE